MQPTSQPEKQTGLSTFGGVFTPSLLTILGVIMYLRFGWVLGNVGLLGTLLIVTLATAITFLTGLSISAIATNQQVKIGGAYYMISRSLGIEAGGAVGIPLYFAQALSVGLYVIGFAESVSASFPSLDEKAVGMVTTILVTLVALKSAKAAIQAQYIIMGAIVLSLLSLLFGSPIEETSIEWWADPEAGRESFWVVFAVFFPAVTGIMAGVNLSGDLEDPARSIPRGTMAAIGTGYVIYMALPVLLSLQAGAEALIDDPLVMRRIAFWGDAILLGVWGATLSSAVGSILGAPRVLQALARDGVLPPSMKIFGQGHGPQDEPRIGTAITFAVAFVTVALGDLNLVAPILTMFFLTTYGVLNVTAGVERLLGNPSYRPQFRVHWIWSFLGAAGCVAVMFLIDWSATIAAIVIVGMIFFWLERRELESAWGDVRSGLWLALTRTSLYHINTDPDPKNWRPHLLVLSGAPTRRWHLIAFASSLTHNRALLTVSTVVPRDTMSTDRLRAMETSIHEYLDRNGVRGLVRITSATNPFEGAVRLVETYGLGPLVPNTIVLGDSEESRHRADFCAMITRFHRARRNVAVVRYDDERGFGEYQRIDMWWGGLQKNGGLMMIFAYLLQTSIAWRGAEVRLKMVVPDKTAAQTARINLVNLVAQLRTQSVPEIVVSDGRSFDEILHTSSAEADLVLMGMATPDAGFEAYYESLQQRITGLPSTVLVLAAEDLAFGEVLLSD